jgi:putative heme-binding domain-containing protein
MAPAGAISRCDLDGKNWEVLCIGLRNTYDFDFNSDGEILLYDSDMEWDTGTPWYRPTRVLHPVSGAEFGWRNGTGKWPDYYPDSLPAVANTGLGSPTGVNFGYGAKFPAKYQRAFFIDDWAYGKVFAVHTTPHGASYTGTFEPFLVGKPFNVTDICINTDGNMYITIGGRGTQSGLYRVSYTGNEPTTPAPKIDDPAAAEARALRKQLEAFHGKTDLAAVDFAWPHLNSPDRYIRYAARLAIEWQPVDQWAERALTETRPTAAINALLALTRYGDKSLQPRILAALGKLPTHGFSEEQVLEMLRTMDMCFIRMGKLDEFASEAIANQIIIKYPAPTFNVNRELVQLLAYLDCAQVVAPTMKLLAAAKTQEEQLHYVLALRVVKKGWTLDQRKAYFTWMNLAETKYIGGHSFKNFIKRIREDAVKTLTPEEKTTLEPILKGAQNAQVAQVTKPRQFVSNWQMDDLIPEIDKATKGRSFEKGHQVFLEAQCMTCHRFTNEGGGTGPDLTGVGNRFSPTDVLEATLLPSKVISDQYQPTELLTKDKDVIIGQIESEDADKVIIRTNPLAPDPVTVPKANILKRRPSRVSIMPTGMVDNFSTDEILDLIAYLRSGGDKNDKAFKN